MQLKSLVSLLAYTAAWAPASALNSKRDFQADCSAIASQLKIQNATVWFSEALSAGATVSVPELAPVGCASTQSVTKDICRVALYVASSEKSGTTMEAWLPKDWSGRFLSTGNGGLGGCIDFSSMDYAATLGFASVGTNNGHNGTTGNAFYQNEEVVKDFAYRSIHTGVVVGKEITASFYGRAHNKSYYLGCSTGGRQGFKSVQDYPEDFDGVVAGAPAFDFTHLISWSGSFYKKTGPPNSPTWLSQAKLNLLHDEIMRQCDGIDGVRDGIIEDTSLCQPKFEGLLCSGNTNSTKCLTSTQIKTANSIFSPLYGENNALIYPRIQPVPGAMAGAGGFSIFNGIPFPYTVDWFRYVVYNDPNWSIENLGPKDYAAADKKTPYIATWKGDLSAFRDRGGKVLTYHGLIDSLISSDNSARYYDHVAKTMGLPSTALDEFYRFFRIPGMEHCGGGNGAFLIGNQPSSGSMLEPERNVLTAMVKWVEEGVAPDTVLGTKFVNDQEGQGIAFQRRHCRYPLRNVWDGKGDYKKPESWSCKRVG